MIPTLILKNMRTKPATRYSAPQEHNSYGIYNWFRNLGITNHDIINECVYNFCEKWGFKGLTKTTPEKTKMNFCGNRFQKFSAESMKYLKQNNYL